VFGLIALYLHLCCDTPSDKMGLSPGSCPWFHRFSPSEDKDQEDYLHDDDMKDDLDQDDDRNLDDLKVKD
jgi:hypothetical protein